MSTVIFVNMPQQMQGEVHAEHNAKRNELIPYIESFLRGHALFAGENIAVTFFHAGVASLVCAIDAGNTKRVLKIALKPIAKGESLFLKTWAGVDVRVPCVFEEGTINACDFLLMEYIEADTLERAYSKQQLIEKEIYVQVGRVLRTMHAASSIGFGSYTPVPEFPTFASWITHDERLLRNVTYVREQGLLDDTVHGSFENAVRALCAAYGDTTESVYCHYDLHVGNVFATTPLTVFDPNPFFNHPYMDLARSIIFGVIEHGDEVREQILKGYCEYKSCDEGLLQAALVVASHEKLSFWHKRGYVKEVDMLRTYLGNTKYLLP